MTEAYVPSLQRRDFDILFSALEKRPRTRLRDKREITQKTIGPLKFTTALPISAPYSSCSLRMDRANY